MRRLAAGLMLLILAVTKTALAEITHVTHRPAIFEPEAGESAEIRFRLTEPAEVELTIYDARDRMVRALRPDGVLAAGDHRIRWDGRDSQGRSVPPEAYTYAVEAFSAQNTVFRWDVTDSAGSIIDLTDLRWNAASGQVSYRVEELARVRIRIGLQDGGPLLKTLIDWVPRTPGPHEESWDGRDASNVLALAEHPALLLQAEAFALPSNAIVVGPPGTHPRFVSDLPSDTRLRAAAPAPQHHMMDYARQSAETRSDFLLALSLPKGLERTADGVPIVREAVPVRIEVSDPVLAQAANERSESVLYVDGRFASERESGFLPMTWKWDPTGHSPGLHHLTANLRGYEGHFGIGTAVVWVEAPAKRAQP